MRSPPEPGPRLSRLLARLHRATRGERLALAAAGFVVYALAFASIYRLIGPAVGAFGFGPALVAAALLGQRAGVISGIVMLPLNEMLYARFEPEPRGMVASTIVIAVIGGVVGRLRDLRLRHEHQRLELEEALGREQAARAQVAEEMRQRQAAELELRQAQKLESVGRLAAGVAHEINTPVQFVSDSVHFVRDAASELILLLARYRRGCPDITLDAEEAEELDYLVEQLPRALDRSLDGLARVATIVRSLKQFAHPDQGDMSTVDLNQAIVATLTIARNEYKYVADIETDLGELPPVTCQVGELNQAVLNLVVNAAHAIGDAVAGTEARGKITVRTRQDGDDMVRISVSDSGTGIPEAIRERIFEPFFTTKEVGRGTGQGLAIARHVVREKHGGDITFDTEMGKGTTFVIRLRIDGRPRSTEAQAA